MTNHALTDQQAREVVELFVISGRMSGWLTFLFAPELRLSP